MKDGAHPESPERVAEVVEASTIEFTAQCYQLYDAPPLGSLVRCGDDNAVFGIVFEVATRSMDPTRRPIARGRDEETEEAVYLNNPQITRLLLTDFRSAVVGHRSDGDLRRFLAPLPPRIHSFVYRCSDEELRGFSDSLDFMPILFALPVSATGRRGRRLSAACQRVAPGAGAIPSSMPVRSWRLSWAGSYSASIAS